MQGHWSSAFWPALCLQLMACCSCQRKHAALRCHKLHSMDSRSVQLAAGRRNVQHQSGSKNLRLLDAALQVEPLLDLEVPSSLLPADQLEALLAERRPHFVPVEDPSVDSTGDLVCC